jgi:hypothetical protein
MKTLEGGGSGLEGGAANPARAGLERADDARSASGASTLGGWYGYASPPPPFEEERLASPPPYYYSAAGAGVSERQDGLSRSAGAAPSGFVGFVGGRAASPLAAPRERAGDAPGDEAGAAGAAAEAALRGGEGSGAAAQADVTRSFRSYFPTTRAAAAPAAAPVGRAAAAGAVRDTPAGPRGRLRRDAAPTPAPAPAPEPALPRNRGRFTGPKLPPPPHAPPLPAVSQTVQTTVEYIPVRAAKLKSLEAQARGGPAGAPAAALNAALAAAPAAVTAAPPGAAVAVLTPPQGDGIAVSAASAVVAPAAVVAAGPAAAAATAPAAAVAAAPAASPATAPVPAPAALPSPPPPPARLSWLPAGVLAPPFQAQGGLGAELSSLEAGSAAQPQVQQLQQQIEAAWAASAAVQAAAPQEAPSASDDVGFGPTEEGAGVQGGVTPRPRDSHGRAGKLRTPAGVEVAAIPAHNSAAEGQFPLRSGLADAGHANKAGYYGGTGASLP